LTFVSLGYVIVGLARSAESGAAIGQLIQFPMMMLSGSIMAADFLPGFFRPIVAAMPLTYLSDLLRQTMVGMTPMYPMIVDFAVLGAWFVGLSLLAARLWRWE
jgi:ABC-2 type transport system permease protein